MEFKVLLKAASNKEKLCVAEYDGYFLSLRQTIDADVYTYSINEWYACTTIDLNLIDVIKIFIEQVICQNDVDNPILFDHF